MGNEAATSPLDQLFYVGVIGGSFLIASVRKVHWRRLFAANKSLMLLYTYFALSIVWSGDPSGSAKRLAKDFGLMFVIGVIVSERDPLQAARAIYVRCACVLFPLSVVFVKYYPNFSRVYALGGEITITGVTTQKNSLGEICLIFCVFLVWDILEGRQLGVKAQWRHIPWEEVALFAMGLWLLYLSQSKTALLCMVVGIVLLVRSDRLATKSINRSVFLGVLALPLLMFFSQQFSSVIAPIVAALGRNMTFTGRTDIWEHITWNTVNPLVGSGFWNFWGGRGGYEISQAMNTPIPNAHDGYIDIYLDGGVIALALLFWVLWTSGGGIIRKLKPKKADRRFVRLRFAVLIVAIVYNLSEASYMRMGPLWFTTLLMLVDFPSSGIASGARIRSRMDEPMLAAMR
jgi:O-antigen ligase